MTAGLGIDKLLEWVEKIWEWFIPFFVVRHYEAAVVLRFGHYHRVVGVGFHWMWPCGIEEVYSENFKPDGWQTADQSITLKGGAQLTLSYTIVWVIDDIKQLLLEVEDKDTVHFAIQGYVQEFLQRHSVDELLEMRAWAAESGKRHGLRERLVRYVDDQTRDWTGIKVTDILIRDFTMTSLKNGVVRVLQ